MNHYAEHCEELNKISNNDEIKTSDMIDRSSYSANLQLRLSFVTKLLSKTLHSFLLHPPP